MRALATIAAAVAALATAGAVGADNPQLVGTTGPGFSISLKDASGNAVTHLDPGTYTLVVHDLSDIHDFHLAGPGGDLQVTSVEFVGDKTVTVTLVNGTYMFFCAPHATAMHGQFTVGTPPPTTTTTTTTPPPPPRIAVTATLGAGGAVAFPRRLKAGRYAIRVVDRSARDNVHLRGPGVDRRTGRAFRGVVTWKVSLARGTYRVWSDAHPKLARTVTVT